MPDSPKSYFDPELQYKFSGEAEGQAGQFDAVRDSILNWVQDQGLAQFSAAQRKAPAAKSDNGDVSIAQYVLENGVRQKFFAVRLRRPREGLTNATGDPLSSHRDDAALWVTTEVVLHATANGLSLHVTKSHELKKHLHKLDRSQLKVKHPAILDAITGLGLNFKSLSAGWPYSAEATVLDSDAALEKFLGKRMQRGFLNDEKPRLPVIFVVGSETSSGWNQAAANELARQTFGFAHVVYASAETAKTKIFGSRLGINWTINSGEARQFNSGWSAGEKKPERHPHLPSLPAGDKASRKAIIQKFTVGLIQSKGGTGEPIIGFESVNRPVRQELLQKNAGDPVGQAERIQLLEIENNDLRQQRDEMAKLADEYFAESSTLSEQLEAVRAELEALKRTSSTPPVAATTKTKTKKRWKEAEEEVFGIPIPTNVAFVKEWAEQYFPQSLVLSKDFVAECVARGNNYEPARARDLFTALTIMGIKYGAHHDDDNLKSKSAIYGFDGKRLEDILAEHQIAGITISNTSEQTLRKFGEQYQLRVSQSKIPEINGTWSIQRHIKSGSGADNANTMLRMYYADTEDPKDQISPDGHPARGQFRYIIGHMGHLKTVNFNT